uniref:Uncharacterized protein n=2 Tax=Arion vulgaris TaxID=1028688 RepID=A0A0B6ZRB6_9EUPU
MTVSRLDQLYRRLLLTKFFTRGWGKPDNLKRLLEFRKILSNRDTCQHLVPADYPITIDKEYRDGECVILEGHFTSPFIHQLPGIMPKEVETACFQMILPLQWQHSTLKPVCIHLAGTGDHYFWRRRLFTARPLLKEAGIASILLENPYYGTRKPKQQLRSSLHNVSDLFVMGGALVLESLALLHWCEREGWGPLGLSGVSMGGHMASLAATNWTKPISLVPCLSWSTASCVFTQGVMSGAIPWKTLEEQFFENNVYLDEIRKLIISPENKYPAYSMGQQFVKDYTILQVDSSVHLQQKDQQAQILTSSGMSTLAAAASLGTQTQQSLTRRGAVDVSSPFMKLSNSYDKNKPNSKSGNNSEYCEPQPVVGINSLTCEDYLDKVDELKSFSTNPLDTSQITEPATGLISAVSSENLTPEFNSFSSSSSPQVSSQPQHHSATSPMQQQSATSALHSLSSLSSSVELSASLIDNCQSNQTGPLESDAAYHKIGHAAVKPPQKTGIASLVASSNLTLKDIISKSRLMSSRQSSSLLPNNKEHVKDLQREALDFMTGVMDECTHLGNFSVPVDPELVIIVSARQDAYVPKDGVIGLDQLWPGCEVRYVDQGHVGAVLFNQNVFRKAVIDAFERQIKKYYQSPSSPGMEHSAKSFRS